MDAFELIYSIVYKYILKVYLSFIFVSRHFDFICFDIFCETSLQLLSYKLE